jgi:hypothetical protein
MKPLVMLVGLWAIAGTALAGSDIKRWVDAAGQVHFGDQPPPGIAYDIQQAAPATIPADDTPSGLRPGELEMLKRYEDRMKTRESPSSASDAKRSKTATGSGESKVRAARCAYYRRRLEHYEAKRRQGYTRGEEEKLKDNLAWAQMKVAEQCP